MNYLTRKIQTTYIISNLQHSKLILQNFIIVYSKAAKTCKINLHPKYTVYFDIRQMLNWWKYVRDGTIFPPDEIVCLVVYLDQKKIMCKHWLLSGGFKKSRKTTRAAAYHATPIRLFLKSGRSLNWAIPEQIVQKLILRFLPLKSQIT